MMDIQLSSVYRGLGLLIALLGGPTVGVYIMHGVFAGHPWNWAFGSIAAAHVMLLGTLIITRGNIIRRFRRREQA